MEKRNIILFFQKLLTSYFAVNFVIVGVLIWGIIKESTAFFLHYFVFVVVVILSGLSAIIFLFTRLPTVALIAPISALGFVMGEIWDLYAVISYYHQLKSTPIEVGKEQPQVVVTV